jgi:hypothetical protein
VQLQALLVHVSSNSWLQQHHFYLQCFNRTEQNSLTTSHVDFNKFRQISGMFLHSMFLDSSFVVIFSNRIAQLNNQKIRSICLVLYTLGEVTQEINRCVIHAYIDISKAI